MGASATAPLPTGWKMSAAGAGTLAGYDTVTNLSAVSQQASSGAPTAGGRYNWGSSATDRAAGFMTSGGYASPNAIMAAYINNTGSTITSITLSFTYERYRINTSAASVAFFTSTDGSTWTPQANGDSGPFATGASSYTFSGGTTVPVNITLSGLNVSNSAQFYVKWVFTNTGNTFSQGLGLDDVSLTADTAVSGAPVINSPLTASVVAFQATANIYQITASNSPLSFGATGLPAGLSVDAATGIISGTATVAPGTYPVAISATNAQGTGSATLSLTVTKNPSAPTITSGLTATGLVNDPSFSYQIVADNSPTSYESGALPSGLTLNASTGLISGTPTAGGVFNVSITASNALGSDTKTLAITINSPPVITSALSGSLYSTNAFGYTITASFAPTSFGASGLPVGWTIDSTTGVITSGVTPLSLGPTSFQISATNGFGFASDTYNLAVYDQAAQDAVPLSVVVNKYVNSTPDKVQLLVTGNNTAGSSTDMRGMIVKDFSSSMANDSGGKFVFTTNALWSSVSAGTLIALSAGNTQPEDIDPSDFYLAINLGNTNYFTSGGGSFDIGTTDMLMVKAAGSGVSGVAGGIHALAGGAAGAQFTAFTGAKLIAAGTSGTDLGVAALNSTASLANFGASGAAAATDAQGGLAAASLNFASWNNSNNQTYVESLRLAVPAISVNPTSLSNLTATQGSFGPSTNFTASASNLSNNITVTATDSNNFAVSTNNADFTNTLTLPTNATGGLSNTPVYVRLTGLAQGPQSSTVSLVSGSVSTNVSVSGTVAAPPVPTLTASPTNVVGLQSSQGSPSGAPYGTYSLSGTNITNSVTLSAPSGIEISYTNDGSGFVNSLAIPVAPPGGVFSTNVFVRISSTAALGGFTNFITNSTVGGASNAIVAVGGIVQAAGSPTITPGNGTTLSGYSTIRPNPSTNQQIQVSGSNLTAPITITPPPGWQVSATNTNSFTSTPVILATNPAGIVSNTPLFIRLAGTNASATNYPSSVLSLVSGTLTNNVLLSGTVSNPTPSLTATPASLTGFGTIQGTASTAQTLTVDGTNLTANVIITAPAKYEVSTNNGTSYAATATLVPTSGTLASTNLLVRIAASAASGAATGTLTVASTGATTRDVGLSGTVIPPPSMQLIVPAILPAPGQTLGQIVLSSPAVADVVVTLLNNRPSVLQIPATVTVPLGQKTASFTMTTISVGSDTSARIEATAAGYGLATANTIISASGVQAAPLLLDTNGVPKVYRQDFAGFNADRPILPLGWRATDFGVPFSVTPAVTFGPDFLASTYSAWATLTDGVKYSTALTRVFGFQHSTAAPAADVSIATQSVITRNDTGGSLTGLRIRYNGRTTRTAGDPVDPADHNPAYLVKVGIGSDINALTWSQPIVSLAYSTANTDNQLRQGVLSGVTIPAGQFAVISWTSSGASGPLDSKQIGISDVQIEPIVPTIAVSPPEGNNSFSTTLGSVSSPAQPFFVEGAGLTAGVTVTAPTGFEVSTSFLTGYAASVSLPATAGAVDATVYVRLLGTAVGAVQGNMTFASAGATTVSAPVSGVVFAAGSTPQVLASTTSLAAFTTEVTQRSAFQTFSVSALNIGTTPVVLTAPAGFEISLDRGSNYGQQVAINPLAGAINARAIYVRMTGAVQGSFNGTITITNFLVTSIPGVTVSGTVGPPRPTIFVNPTTLPIMVAAPGAPSQPRSFVVSGRDLTGDVRITPPNGFQISRTANNLDFSDAPILLTPAANGTLTNTTNYVRLSGAIPGEFSDFIELTSQNAERKLVEVTGTVASAPVITAYPPSVTFADTYVGKASDPEDVEVAGQLLVAVNGTSQGIIATTPAGFQVRSTSPTSIPANTWTDSVTLIAASAATLQETLQVRVAPDALAASPLAGELALSSGPTITTVQLSAVVCPKPSVTVNPTALSGFDTVLGRPSPQQTFIVSGADLQDALILTASAGYEISTNNSTWSTSLTLARQFPSGGGGAPTITAQDNAGNYATNTAITYVGSEAGNVVQNWSNPGVAKIYGTGGSQVYGTAGYYQIRPTPNASPTDVSQSASAGNDLGISAASNPTLYSVPSFATSAGKAGSFVNFGPYPVFRGPNGSSLFRQGALSVSVNNGPFNSPAGNNASFFGEALQFTVTSPGSYRVGLVVDAVADGTYAPNYVGLYNPVIGQTVFSTALVRDGIPDMVFFDVTAKAGDTFTVGLWQNTGTQSVAALSMVTFDVISGTLSGWTNGANGGFGFGAWNISLNQGTGFAGNFIGDPNAAGVTGMGTQAFGLYANPVGSGAFVEVRRNFVVPLADGETFSFQWGLNWDSGGGNKGFNIFAGATQVANVNMGGFPGDITFNGSNTGIPFGTEPMTWSATFTAPGNLEVTSTGRDGAGGVIFRTNIATPAAPTGFAFYTSAMEAGDQRQAYFNNLRVGSGGDGCDDAFVPDTTIYVRLTGAAPEGTRVGSVTADSLGATPRTVTLNGVVWTISGTPGALTFYSVLGYDSDPQLLTIGGANRPSAVRVTPPAGFIVRDPSNGNRADGDLGQVLTLAGNTVEVFVSSTAPLGAINSQLLLGSGSWSDAGTVQLRGRVGLPADNDIFVSTMIERLMFRIPDPNSTEMADYLALLSGGASGQGTTAQKAAVIMQMMGFDAVTSSPNYQTFDWEIDYLQITDVGDFSGNYVLTSVAFAPYARLGLTPSEAEIRQFVAAVAGDPTSTTLDIIPPPPLDAAYWDPYPVPNPAIYNGVPGDPWGATQAMAQAMTDFFNSATFQANEALRSKLLLNPQLFVNWLANDWYFGVGTGSAGSSQALISLTAAATPVGGQGAAASFRSMYARALCRLKPTSNAVPSEKAFQMRMNLAALDYQLWRNWSYTTASPGYSPSTVQTLLRGPVIAAGATINGTANSAITPYQIPINQPTAPINLRTYFRVVGGALPAGVTLSPSGMLSGTPATSGVYNFTVIAQNLAGDSASRNFTLNVAVSAKSQARQWMFDHGFGTASMSSKASEDGDQDGLNLADEYAFGGNPLAPDAGLVKSAPHNATTMRLEWLALEIGATYSIEGSSDLQTWSDVTGITINDLGASGIYRRREVLLPMSGEHHFFRVRSTFEPGSLD